MAVLPPSGQFIEQHVCLFSIFHRKGATDVKDTAEMVKEALKQAERAQSSVTEALKQATADIKGTQDLLVSVSLRWFISPVICSRLVLS